MPYLDQVSCFYHNIHFIKGQIDGVTDGQTDRHKNDGTRKNRPVALYVRRDLIIDEGSFQVRR